MQFLTVFATLAAFATAATAIDNYRGEATIYKSGPNACNVAPGARFIALPSPIFDESLCGTTVAVQNLQYHFGGQLVVGDRCDTCVGNAVQISENAFGSFLDDNDKELGVTAFEAAYAVGLFGRK
ncbi:hypothetical protein MIND_00197200 [Mycena indigotica]|uniref:Uncharacterized protein n=1 Tax=Mycena indigotica TaxID=2126181 RepID=A0A8H6WAR6_9AGAR|nr:uncharacterized protein MIND_00197200 [Mycena indigotica]KAF7311864.1 hypothetical protein MIND_00197200 [Mycena indigotica]